MAETFGQTIKLGLEVPLAADYIYGCKFTSGSAGDLASMTMYLTNIGPAANLKLAIYDSSLDKLANGETEERNIPSTTDAWEIFNFPISPSVAASTVYWLCWWTTNSIKGRYDAGITDQCLYKSLPYNSWPATLLPNYTDEQFSVYATYEEVPPPKKTLVQAVLISIPPLIALPTLAQILRLTGG